MHAVPHQVQAHRAHKPSIGWSAVLPALLPFVVGALVNVLFWSGVLIPFNPAEAEFFVYLNAAIILLAVLLALAGLVMALVCGMRSVSCLAFGDLTANSIIVTALGLTVWGVMFGAV